MLEIVKKSQFKKKERFERAKKKIDKLENLLKEYVTRVKQECHLKKKLEKKQFFSV